MKYTKRLSEILNSQGSPTLSHQSFSTVMNIIYLEGAISSLRKVKSTNKNPNTKDKYDFLINDYQEKLNALTQDLSPTSLFDILINGKIAVAA